jgi:hypothetical protein
VPVDFPHPIVWRQRWKRRYAAEPALRWTDELAQMEDKKLSEAQAEWDEGKRAWDAGENKSRGRRWSEDDVLRAEERKARAATDPFAGVGTDPEWLRERVGQLLWESYEECSGERPPFYRDDEGELVHDSCLYQPEEWPPPEERGYVIYQTVGEGSPITPCFATPEELIDWLVEKGTAWDDPMSREAAERFVRGSGWLPSMVRFGDGHLAKGMAIEEHKA